MHTTTRLGAVTQRLTQALDDTLPPDAHRGVLAVIVVVLVVAALANSALRPGASAPILIVATPTRAPIVAGARGVVRPVERAAPPVAIHPLATIAPPSAPELSPAEVISVMQAAPPAATPDAGYVANTDAGAVFVPDDATPVPTGASYTGPFLVPATAAPSESGPRLCTGFHDWRDFDPNYASSPVCNQP